MLMVNVNIIGLQRSLVNTEDNISPEIAYICIQTKDENSGTDGF